MGTEAPARALSPQRSSGVTRAVADSSSELEDVLATISPRPDVR